MSLASALDGWAERRPLPSVRLGVAALALAAETGGASARAVDGVAETIRGRLAVGAEVRALSAQARLSALVIVLAPLAFSALAVASDGGTADLPVPVAGRVGLPRGRARPRRPRRDLDATALPGRAVTRPSPRPWPEPGPS